MYTLSSTYSPKFVKFIGVAAASLVVALSPGAATLTQAADNCALEQASFGGDGGSAFAAVPVASVGLRTGSRVDAIILDGDQHGGDGGSDRGVLKLQDGEYIAGVVVRHGSEVDAVEFRTNMGRTIGGGGGGGTQSVLFNIRVQTIGGRSGSRLDNLQLNYCANYIGG